MKLIVKIAVLSYLICAHFAQADRLSEPYGICAHISRSGERPHIDKTLSAAKDAGISWIRTDLDWDGMEFQKGKWKFSHIDSMLEKARAANVKILPILAYTVPWASPAYKHLDEWGNYVKTVAARYKDDFDFWEVYNEPNVKIFWKEDSPRGADYAKLLERSWREIKSADPSSKVLYSGTAGVPLHFIEDSLKAGAGKYFDIMNIHPYNWGGGGRPEAIAGEVEKLRKLMDRYGIGDKPIWITEVGWPTSAVASVEEPVIAALKRIGIDSSKIVVSVVSDTKAGYDGVKNLDYVGLDKISKSVRTVGLSQIKSLDVKKFPVLIPSLNESFPEKYMGDLADYVGRGGTIIFPTNGLPLFYALSLEGGARKTVGDLYLRKMGVAWETWWTKKGVPEKEQYQKPAPGFESDFKFEMIRPASRFLTAAALKNGDEFIPLIEAGTKDYKGAVAGIYKFKNAGNIIVFTNANPVITENAQAQNLAVAYIVALSSGVDKMFWYNLRAGEWKTSDPEANFGIVHKDMSPKPAYKAMQVLSSVLPEGSSRPKISKFGGVYVAEWTKPDSVKVSAIWAPFKTKMNLLFDGNVKSVVDFMGKSYPASIPEYVSASPFYIEGVSNARPKD